MSDLASIYTIWLRNVKRYFRFKSRIIGGLGQPLLFLIVLGFGLNSILTLPGVGHNYLKFIIPGIVSMSILFTAVFSGVQVIWDRQFGFLKETLIAPVSRISIMLGQATGGATTALFQGLIVLFISFAFATFIPSLGGFIITLIFMALIGLSCTSLGIAIASRLEDMQGFQLIVNFVIMPIFFLSGAIFPLSNAPKILKIIAYLDPLTYGVEGMRYGLLGTSQINPLISFVVMALFSLAIVIFGGYLFNKIKV